MKTTKTRWAWDDHKIESLISNLIEYKLSKSFEGLDFEADSVSLYSNIRDFGPKQLDLLETAQLTKEELMTYKKNIELNEKQIKEGYNRVKTKVKELRRGYKNAVDTGRRSGSGRLVHDHLYQLQEIWGDVPQYVH